MTTFVRKEKQHLDVLEQRLTHLHEGDDHPERSGNPAYPPGEANALVWALAVIRGTEEPIELRIGRVEHALRVLQTRIGRIEHELEEEE